MTWRRNLVIAAFAIIVAFNALGIVGFVTADELGGFAIIGAQLACLLIPVPMLIIAFVDWIAEQASQRRPGRAEQHD